MYFLWGFIAWDNLSEIHQDVAAWRYVTWASLYVVANPTLTPRDFTVMPFTHNAVPARDACTACCCTI